MLARRIRTVPAWVASVALHLVLFAACAGFVVRQATRQAEGRDVVFLVNTTPPAPPRLVEKPAPPVQAEIEAPLLIEAPIDNHNETANRDDARTARLAETLGLGGGLGPTGRGGRRYARSEGARRGAASARSVEEGLEWLARHQSREGHWGNHVDQCSGEAPDCWNVAGNGSRRMAISALALLAFLANGESPTNGPHAQGVRRGLDYLLAHQSKPGRFESSYPHDDYYSLYEQAIATWAVAEAAAATRDGRYLDATRRAVDNLERRVVTRVDTSVMGFVVMALRSAECAGVVVPPKAREWGPKYFQLLVEKKGDFAYRIENDLGKPPLSCVGIYASLLYGIQEVNPKVKKAIDAALATGPARCDEGAMTLYHRYYWTLSYLHAGGRDWTVWDARVRDYLTGQQRRSGCERGSWDPMDERISNRVLSTSLAVLTLHVCDQKLLLHRSDSASTEAKRVGEESMAYGELLWEEAMGQCARAARGPETGVTNRDAFASVEAFLAWTTKARPETREDREALSAWTRDVQEAAAEVAARSGDLDGALARLDGVSDPSPGALVLRATILARHAAREVDAAVADGLRREAIGALVEALEEAPSRQGDLYRLLACLVHDLRESCPVEASVGSLAWLAVRQGELGREARRALESRQVPRDLAARLRRHGEACDARRGRQSGLSGLFDEWKRETLLALGRVELVGGRAAEAVRAAQEAALSIRARSTERDVVSLIGAASLKAATTAWNAGDRSRAAEYARVGASAYAYLAARDPSEGVRLALPIADLYFIAGEYREAVRRYRVALAQVVKEMGDPLPVRERLLAAARAAGDAVAEEAASPAPR